MNNFTQVLIAGCLLIIFSYMVFFTWWTGEQRKLFETNFSSHFLEFKIEYTADISDAQHRIESIEEKLGIPTPITREANNG